MTKSLISTLLALCLATCAPALAQQSIPQLGIDKSGSCRNFSIYDPTKPGSDKMVPMLCIDTTTHLAKQPSVEITGGTITGITDLALADGGTGASDAASARSNLGLGTAAVVNTGVSGATIPLLNGTNIWSAAQSLATASGSATLSIDAIAGQSALVALKTAGSERWRMMRSNGTEVGANAGSDLMITRYSDAGTFLGTALTIARADGTTTVAGNVVADANNTRSLGSSAAYWQRAYIRNPVLGFRTVTGDANFTMTVGAEPYETLHSGTITADRTCTLSTTGAVSGDRFKLVRSGGGAFNISFGGLKNLAQNTWAIATYNGSAWVLTGYGTL